MHLRLPIVVGIVALAGGAAFVRPHLPAAAPAASLAMTNGRAPDPTAASPAGDSSAANRSNRSKRREGASFGGAPSTIVVYVAGDVRHPGLYRLAPRSRADDAVRAAGGARDDADLVALNLAAPVGDGDEVAVLVKAAPSAPAAHRRSRRAASGVRAAETASAGTSHTRRKHRKRRGTADAGATNDAPNDLININVADASELETLPGIGAALAERIVAVREASGGFASADDLLDVGGMTQSRLDALAPYVVVR